MGENTRKKFCSNCGVELDENDKFCDSCGKEVKKRNSYSNFNDKKDDSINDDSVKTKKCPNCGAQIKSFQTCCEFCSAEISNIKASKYVEKFSDGLLSIKTRPFPEYNGRDSLVKAIFGKDFNDNDDRREFDKKCKEQREQEIANYILNFPIPNSNEDLMEFMILVSSNIDLKDNSSEELQKAWVKKMDQIYKKAKLSIKDNKDLSKIEEIYSKKKQDIKDGKIRSALKIVGGIILYFLIMGILIAGI